MSTGRAVFSPWYISVPFQTVLTRIARVPTDIFECVWTREDDVWIVSGDNPIFEAANRLGVGTLSGVYTHENIMLADFQLNESVEKPVFYREYKRDEVFLDVPVCIPETTLLRLMGRPVSSLVEAKPPFDNLIITSGSRLNNNVTRFVLSVDWRQFDLR